MVYMRKLRKENGLTMKKLGELVGVSEKDKNKKTVTDFFKSTTVKK